MPVKRFLEQPAQNKFDIVFLDPPYDATSSEVIEVLNLLSSSGFLKRGSVIAIERDSKSKPIIWPKELTLLKERKYGSAIIFYAEAC
jgi:16S rRNA (guanine966-N2)-methyltransferase